MVCNLRSDAIISYGIRAFSFSDNVQIGNEMILSGFAAVAALHVLPAFALPGDDVAVVVQRTSGIAIARCAPIAVFRKSVSFRHALVAVASHYQSLAGALSTVEIATEIVDCSQNVAGALLATVKVRLCQVPIAFSANVTTTPLDILFAVASTGFSLAFRIRN